MFKTVGALIRALAPKRKPLEPEVRFCRPPFSVPPAPRSVDDVLRAMPTAVAVRGTFRFASLLDWWRAFDCPPWIEARAAQEIARRRWWWR